MTTERSATPPASQRPATTHVETRRVAFAMPEKPRKPWTKVRAEKFKNDTVKFRHLDDVMSSRQKGVISALAAKAFAFLKVQGWTLEEWRRNECITACGARLSEAPGRMYPRLKSHFEYLLGNIDQGLKWEAKSSNAAQRKEALLHLIKKCLLKLPRLEGDVLEWPADQVRVSAWAWADAIAMRKFGGQCRQLTASQLGTLHAVIKREVSKKRTMEKAANKAVRAAKKAAKAVVPRKSTKGAKVKLDPAGDPLSKVVRAEVLPCKCGCVDLEWSPLLIRCKGCNRSVEGDDMCKVIKAWNKGRGAQ